MKNNTGLILGFLLLGCNPLLAQDVIFFNNGTMDTAKVLEVGAKLVSYKKFSRHDGPIYKVYKTDVQRIEYGDSTVEIFSLPVKNTEDEDVPLRIVSANALGIFVGNINVGYEKLMDKGHFGLRANLLTTFLPVFKSSLLLAGLDFNFYPRGINNRISYFVGPSFRYGFADYFGDGLAFDEEFLAFLFSNGLVYGFKNNLYMATQLGMGIGMYNYKELEPYGYLMLNIGLKL